MLDNLTSKQSETRAAFPLWASDADLVHGDSTPLSAQMGCTKDGYAQASIKVPTYFGVGTLPFCGDFAARRLEKMVASRPSRPSTEKMKGVKCRRLSRQAPRYFRFFSFLCVSKTLAGSHLQ